MNGEPIDLAARETLSAQKIAGELVQPAVDKAEKIDNVEFNSEALRNSKEAETQYLKLIIEAAHLETAQKIGAKSATYRVLQQLGKGGNSAVLGLTQKAYICNNM